MYGIIIVNQIFQNKLLKKNFDSKISERKLKMKMESEWQKNTNCPFIKIEYKNCCNMQLISNIKDACTLNEKLNVNKMLSVLIFLILK